MQCVDDIISYCSGTGRHIGNELFYCVVGADSELSVGEDMMLLVKNTIQFKLEDDKHDNC